MILEGEALAKWIDQQPTTWVKFTLKSKNLTTREAWERTLNEAFAELRNTYPKPNEKRRRKNAAMPTLLHATFMGGEKQNGVLLHAQGVVELIDNDLDRLQRALGKSWSHAINRTIGTHYKGDPIKARVEEAPWLEIINDSVYNYIYYLMRHEGAELGIGTDKLVTGATVLVAEHNLQFPP